MTIQALTKTGTSLLQIAPPKLTTQLAKPWHFRRHGRYYLRFRPRNQTQGVFTISLRTSDRTIAMEISSNIQRALAYFHLSKPDATWGELKARLIAIAQECLEAAHGDWGSDLAHSEFYQQMYGALREVGKQGDLSLAQHRALAVGQSLMAAANARIDGNPGALVSIIDKLNQEDSSNSSGRTSSSLSVGGPKESLSWSELSSLYMAEHSVNLKESSRKAAITAHTVIGEAFEAIAVADLRVHTREDMTALRAELLETRKPSTVNNLLAKLTAVLDWAERSDKLPKHYAKKLKLTKGAESARESFTRQQVVTLMAHAQGLPVTSWERWALSLAVITGARVGEISHLTKTDIKQVDGLWCIDINEDQPGKSIKNKHSARRVPLVDGALGFHLETFLQAVEMDALPSDNRIGPARASKVLNLRLKEVLKDSKNENQTFHSLRHHLISSMEAAGVPVAFAQAAAGQSSGTIAYDVYGSGAPMQRVYEAIQKGLMGDAQ